MYSAEKISRTATIRLKGSFEDIFPLFGPVREMAWAEGWEPAIMHLEGENIEERMVFQTKPHLADEEGLFTWTVTKYIPDRGQIEYTIFAPSRIWWIDIDCTPLADDTECEATITYTHIGLNEAGNERNKSALSKMYQHDLKDWELAINHYLATGSMLRHNRHE